jgi:hypothetical protein
MYLAKSTSTLIAYFNLFLTYNSRILCLSYLLKYIYNAGGLWPEMMSSSDKNMIREAFYIKIVALDWLIVF